MSDLNIELCPETGICSVIKADGRKIDLMPDEVGAIRGASGDSDTILRALSEVDSGFAEALGPDEVAQLSKRLK